MARPTTSACSTSARASSVRPAPSARAIAEATPPPMPPLATFSIRAMKGKTSARPASASRPRRPTYQVSAMATKICTTMSAVVGPARRSRLRPIGAVRRGWAKRDSGKQRIGTARPCSPAQAAGDRGRGISADPCRRALVTPASYPGGRSLSSRTGYQRPRRGFLLLSPACRAGLSHVTTYFVIPSEAARGGVVEGPPFVTEATE